MQQFVHACTQAMIALLTLQDKAYRNQTAGFWGALMRNQPLVQHAGGQVQRAVTTVTYRRISDACVQRLQFKVWMRRC